MLLAAAETLDVTPFVEAITEPSSWKYLVPYVLLLGGLMACKKAAQWCWAGLSWCASGLSEAKKVHDLTRVILGELDGAVLNQTPLNLAMTSDAGNILSVARDELLTPGFLRVRFAEVGGALLGVCAEETQSGDKKLVPITPIRIDATLPAKDRKLIARKAEWKRRELTQARDEAERLTWARRLANKTA